MPRDLPAHVSPALEPTTSPSYFTHQRPSSFALAGLNDASATASGGSTSDPSATPPADLLSPAFTPPSTPGTGTPALERDARSYAVDTSSLPTPRLLQQLPKVDCVVRARIPTTSGVEMFLHLYQNDMDNKEHLAIVFGDKIRSKSLDAVREGETEMDRMIRGAYVGRLHPGRTSSRMDASSEGRGSPLLRAVKKKDAGTPVLGGTSGIGAPRESVTPRSALKTVVGVDDSGMLEETAREKKTAPLVRIHSECYTGETVWSARCDCGEQLDEAARLMSLPSASDCGGVIVYLRQEGRGIGLGEKLKAYNLQDLGNDTVEANLLLRHPADARSYGLATAMLVDLGLSGDNGIRLLTNNPDKVRAVEGPNREVVVKERVAMVPLSWTSAGSQGFNSPEVGQYLKTKIEKMGHMLNMGV